MRRCIECGKELVEFAFDTGLEEIWECKYCGARYVLEGDYGELVRKLI
jgi:DNA-directed RNA polymerase subunit RPC12/RpoP